MHFTGVQIDYKMFEASQSSWEIQRVSLQGVWSWNGLLKLYIIQEMCFCKRTAFCSLSTVGKITSHYAEKVNYAIFWVTGTAPKNYIKVSDGFFYLPSTPSNRFLAFFYSFPFYFPHLHFLALVLQILCHQIAKELVRQSSCCWKEEIQCSSKLSFIGGS